MPKFATGNMWDAYDEADLFCITTNSYIKQNGALTMGRGIAREAKLRFPGLEYRLGAAIEDDCGSTGKYGLLVDCDTKIAAFQTKYTWFRDASLELITYSVSHLLVYITTRRLGNVQLNFPGINNGRLTRAEVLPLLLALPDSVTIWELK